MPPPSRTFLSNRKGRTSAEAGAASINVVHTPYDRASEYERRSAFQRCLSESVDVAIANAERDRDEGLRSSTDDGRGCFFVVARAISRSLGRLTRSAESRWRHSRLLDVEVPQTALRQGAAAVGGARTAVVSAVSSGVSSGSFNVAIFGKRKGEGSAVERLHAVGHSLEQRISTLYERACLARAEAARQYSDTTQPVAQRQAAAMRSLKKAKAMEKQSVALAGTSMTIDRHVSMLEDAGLQREVASALSAGVKGMKRSAKALKDVEAVTDEAAEMRDISEDIQSALSELGTSYDDPGVDDDDLLEELAEMVQDGMEKGPNAASSVPVATASRAFPSAPSHSVVAADDGRTHADTDPSAVACDSSSF